MEKLLGKYINGNTKVIIFSDGTKIRETEDEVFKPAFAENCDVSITLKCDGGCEFCYQGCTPNGKHGNILNRTFLNTLHPYTELAIAGNSLDHPDLIPFLEILHDKKIITNMTVNQIHFERHRDFLKELCDKKLIYGLGISLKITSDTFISDVKQFPNAVIHIINGLLTLNDVKAMENKDLKLLILGYKTLERGISFYEKHKDKIAENQKLLKENLPGILNKFKVVSFDNLAIEQLNVKRLLTDEEWNEFYMGDEGSQTFYLDLVNNTFSRNSLCDVKYPLMDSIDDMFKVIQNEK